LERGLDGRSGAGREAASTGAATVLFRVIGFQFKGSDDFGEENPVAKFAADEAGVFANEAKAGALGQGAFEERARVHVPK